MMPLPKGAGAVTAFLLVAHCACAILVAIGGLIWLGAALDWPITPPRPLALALALASLDRALVLVSEISDHPGLGNR